jgi:hypothetical protein
MKKFVLLTMIVCSSLCGCTDAGWERQTAYGSKHTIDMYSGGTKVATWTSTGRPQSLTSEDGWQFVDDSTKQLVIVTGDLVIIKLP